MNKLFHDYNSYLKESFIIQFQKKSLASAETINYYVVFREKESW